MVLPFGIPRLPWDPGLAWVAKGSPFSLVPVARLACLARRVADLVCFLPFAAAGLACVGLLPISSSAGSGVIPNESRTRAQGNRGFATIAHRVPAQTSAAKQLLFGRESHPKGGSHAKRGFPRRFLRKLNLRWWRFGLGKGFLGRPRSRELSLLTKPTTAGILECAQSGFFLDIEGGVMLRRGHL